MCNKPPSELTAEFSSGLMTAGNIENQIMFYTTSSTQISRAASWRTRFSAFSLKRMFAKAITALFYIVVQPTAVFGDRAKSLVCRDNREEHGFALVGHDYRSESAHHFGHCFFECSSEEKCQSVTYLWDQKECRLNKETKKSRPEDFIDNAAATYMENNFRAKKGSKSLIPGHSCQDILTSGDAEGDGEYWIDPTASGDSFIAFCDMTTAQGGWTLIGRFLMKDNNPDNLPSVTSNSYREILPKYKSNNHYLLRKGFNQLRNDMGFTQIRFYCFKKKVGRVLHIMTNKDSKGANVLAYLTDSNSFPRACGSFTRLGDDHSILARNCEKWGHPTENRWGHSGYLKDNRLFSRALLIPWARYYQFIGSLPHACDDDVAKDIAMSLGDLWQIFVR